MRGEEGFSRREAGDQCWQPVPGAWWGGVAVQFKFTIGPPCPFPSPWNRVTVLIKAAGLSPRLIVWPSVSLPLRPVRAHARSGHSVTSAVLRSWREGSLHSRGHRSSIWVRRCWGAGVTQAASHLALEPPSAQHVSPAGAPAASPGSWCSWPWEGPGAAGAEAEP